MAAKRILYTVGHSTRAWDEFVELLLAHRIVRIADVRRFPGSRRYPHFNAGQMAIALPQAGIEYTPFPALGGRRKAASDSPNVGWRNDAFRGYADYMQTPEFQDTIKELEEVARQHPTAVMCSEAVPWRCHRSLIADAMLARGWKVLDVMSPTSAKEHKLPAWAKVKGKRVTYPGEAGLFDTKA